MFSLFKHISKKIHPKKKVETEYSTCNCIRIQNNEYKIDSKKQNQIIISEENVSLFHSIFTNHFETQNDIELINVLEPLGIIYLNDKYILNVEKKILPILNFENIYSFNLDEIILYNNYVIFINYLNYDYIIPFQTLFSFISIDFNDTILITALILIFNELKNLKNEFNIMMLMRFIEELILKFCIIKIKILNNNGGIYYSS